MTDTAKFVQEARELCDAWFSDGQMKPKQNVAMIALDKALDLIEQQYTAGPMTMPHLMNCPHSAAGWCLECVKELAERRAGTERGDTGGA